VAGARGAGVRSADLAAHAWPQADRLFHADPRWLGADAAFSVDLGGERVLWLFGDSFVDADAPGARGERGRARLVRNSIAVQDGLDPSAASIAFVWGPGPSSWMPEAGERWFWPGHGFREPGGPLVLFWTRLRPAPGEGLGFRAEGWKAVAVDDPDAPPGEWAWRELASPPLPEGLVAAQGWCRAGDAWIGLAVREPGDHAGFALRLPAAAARRADLGALELWSGGRWTPVGQAAADAPAVEDAGPELSLHVDEASGDWVHVRSLGFGATSVGLSTAPRPTGPWSEPRVVYRPPESDAPDAFVYAAKAHPELRGADLVLTYAASSFDFARLVADRSLYYPRFVRVSFGER